MDHKHQKLSEADVGKVHQQAVYDGMMNNLRVMAKDESLWPPEQAAARFIVKLSEQKDGQARVSHFLKKTLHKKGKFRLEKHEKEALIDSLSGVEQSEVADCDRRAFGGKAATFLGTVMFLTIGAKKLLIDPGMKKLTDDTREQQIKHMVREIREHRPEDVPNYHKHTKSVLRVIFLLELRFWRQDLNLGCTANWPTWHWHVRHQARCSSVDRTFLCSTDLGLMGNVLKIVRRDWRS